RVRCFDRRADLLRASAHCLAEHLGEVKDPDIGAGHTRNLETGHAGTRVSDFDVDFLVVQFTAAQLLAETVAGGWRRRGADESVEHSLLRSRMGLGLDFGTLLVALKADADLDQIADDLLDITADITDLGELRGL